MNPYRATDGAPRGICIVCYRYGTQTESECPKCHVGMTSLGEDHSAAEVVHGLRLRAQQRLTQPGRRRLLLAIAGGTVLALLTTAILLHSERFEPAPGHPEVDTSLMWSLLLGTFIAFAGTLYLVGLKLFPRPPSLPSPPTVAALAEYLGIVMVDR